MTTRPTDDPMPRDAGFDAAWRAASNEVPPPALDASILAAAHREVGAGPRRLVADRALSARRRWWPLAAAATVAVIAIGIAERGGHDELVAPGSDPSIVADTPAQAAKSVADAPRPASEAQHPSEAQRAPEARPAPEAQSAPKVKRVPEVKRAETPQRSAEPTKSVDDRARVDSGAAPPPAASTTGSAVSTAPALSEPFPAGSPRSSTAESRGAASAPPAPPMSPAAPFADSTRVAAPSAMRPSPLAKTASADAAAEAQRKDRAPLPVNDWIALIRRLRDEGKNVDATRELTAFRAAHVDHEKLLPPDLRDWQPVEK